MLNHFRQGGWLETKVLFQGVVTNAIWTGIVFAFGLLIASVVMLWSYMLGQSGPWIAIAGMGAGGTCMYAIAAGLAVRRQWHQPVEQAIQEAEDKSQQLEQELRVAKEQLAESNHKVFQAQQHAQEAHHELKRAERADWLAKLAEMKALIREQIDAASKEFSFDTIGPWVAGTNFLLSKMKLNNLPYPIHEAHGEVRCREWHQLNIAHLRGLLVTTTEHDAMMIA